MSDLISRSALIKRLWNHHSEVVANPECYTDAEDVADDVCAIVSIIDEFPTIEAVPVVEGEWIEKEMDNFRMIECTCSNCGWNGVDNYDSYVDICSFLFCPNCGARMTGGKE